ncbi:MAG: MBL fold metallo-hydrolase, partial [Planctomycetaceae bacterium]|nr:MBL fold metallo-hydrolase [Planctomycetaceae bacterium]
FYLGLAALAAGAGRWLAPRWQLGLAAVWLSVGLASAILPQQEFRLACTFVSVGHGSATVLELPGGETLLFDAGQLGSPTSGARSVAGFLWSRGITHLDAVVVSHADVDHFNALPELFERFSVGAVYLSTVMLADDSPATQLLVRSIERHGIALRKVSAGNRLRAASDVRLEFLHPTREGVLDSDNANSLVLAVEYSGRRILLTGDLEGRGLNQVLAEEPLDCDIVAAPHHGSPRSNPPGFAAWSTPEWVVISSGLGDDSQEVRRAYELAGARVLNTAEAGAVTFTITPSAIESTAYRQPGVQGER